MVPGHKGDLIPETAAEGIIGEIQALFARYEGGGQNASSPKPVLKTSLKTMPPTMAPMRPSANPPVAQAIVSRLSSGFRSKTSFELVTAWKLESPRVTLQEDGLSASEDPSIPAEPSERFYSMSAQIEAERKQYYDILERSQRGRTEITHWLE